MRAFRDEAGKAKAPVELNLARDVRGNKQGLCKYVSTKRKRSREEGPLLNEAGDLVSQGRGQGAECLLCRRLDRQGWPLGVPGLGDWGQRLEQGEQTSTSSVGGRWPGQGILKQTGNMKVHGP